MSGTRSPPFGVTTVLVCLLFGTNFFLFLFFQYLKYVSKSPAVSENQVAKKKEKELSKPFMGGLDCYSILTSELLRTGLILAMTYVCEYLWIFDHSTKSYSRDLFMFVLILFFAYAFYTIKPIHDLTLLGREQTEEWKGWMQFIFLLYHYFHAEEVYNSVRVMITCYVWMTGFGNFSFFFLKQDFGWLRVLQMFWRLNFSVLLLMWTHGNTYILYYICPMHTFYFIMVYVTMITWPQLNSTKWGIRWKLLVLAIIIYVVWDLNYGIFDIVFAWLGTDKVIGANSGSVWEYYFRTSLDHWSTFLGMVFAANFPLTEQYFVKAKGWPLIVGAILMGGVTIWWLVYCYSLDKLSYNLSHSYFAIIPLTSYIFFRNLTPAIRSGVSMSLHDLGKTTLETYLLQHHIWLTSNAKTLWTITPGHPWINFALATMVFFIVSKELYRLTMSLRGMILPEDAGIAAKNFLGTVLIIGIFFVMAYVMVSLEITIWEILIACTGLSVVMLFVIERFSPVASEIPSYKTISHRFMVWLVIAFVAALLLQLGMVNDSTVAPVDAQKTVYLGTSPTCMNTLSHGHWVHNHCDEAGNVKLDKSIAFCEKNEWIWENTLGSKCPIERITTTKAAALWKGKNVLFVGDSTVRSTYHQFVSLAVPSYQTNYSTELKHQDFVYKIAKTNTSFAFKWSPYAANITTFLTSPSADSTTKYDLIVLGATLWDALHVHDVAAYTKDLVEINTLLKSSSSVFSSAIHLWLLPPKVVSDRLITDEKRAFINEAKVTNYRELSKLTFANASAFHAVLDTVSVSELRETTSLDGVHYGEEVYTVIAQMVTNGYMLQFPKLYSGKTASTAPYRPKVTGAMSFPGYGACMMALIVIMLFTMDGFLGIGFLSLGLFGERYDWEAAYAPFLRIMTNFANKNKEPPVSARELKSDPEQANLLSEEKPEAD